MRQLPLAVAAALLALVACGDNHAGRGAPADAAPSADAPIDGAPNALDGIAAARAAVDGTGLALAIRGATVTYLKPQIGSTTSDPAGFTIQAQKQGPGLFVSVDPATLTPPAAVGDVVDFTITKKGTVSGQPRAQTIANYTRTATGANVAALAQNISAATDVVTAAASYDSELVTVTGSLFEGFTGSGTGFQRAGINTAGLTGVTAYQLRAPATLVDAVDLAKDCQITATNVPLSIFVSAATPPVTQAQIGVFRAADYTVTSCPAPVVVSAAALSLTSVRLTFSRNLLPTSVLADGSQFTFDNGLTASAAVVAGRTVTLVTSAQTPATSYLSTVAASLTDLRGTAVAAPGTAVFAGFAPAVVRINEVNANITGGCDLIELRVIADGSMTGFKLLERTGSLAASELAFTFPSFNVHKNDFIVVHMNSSFATCNPGTATQETTTVTDQPAATFTGNFDTAFDFWSVDAGLVATDNVITVLDAAGTILDAVFISNDPVATATASATETQAAVVGLANQWSPMLATYIDAVFRMNAVDGLAATGTAATGTSIQRVDDTDDNDKADWTTGAGAASTWGALNVGQTAL